MHLLSFLVLSFFSLSIFSEPTVHEPVANRPETSKENVSPLGFVPGNLNFIPLVGGYVSYNENSIMESSLSKAVPGHVQKRPSIQFEIEFTHRLNGKVLDRVRFTLVRAGNAMTAREALEMCNNLLPRGSWKVILSDDVDFLTGMGGFHKQTVNIPSGFSNPETPLLAPVAEKPATPFFTWAVDNETKEYGLLRVSSRNPSRYTKLEFVDLEWAIQEQANFSRAHGLNFETEFKRIAKSEIERFDYSEKLWKEKIEYYEKLASEEEGSIFHFYRVSEKTRKNLAAVRKYLADSQKESAEYRTSTPNTEFYDFIKEHIERQNKKIQDFKNQMGFPVLCAR